MGSSVLWAEQVACGYVCMYVFVLGLFWEMAPWRDGMDIASEVPCFERGYNILWRCLTQRESTRIESTMLSYEQKNVSRVALRRELG